MAYCVICARTRRVGSDTGDICWRSQRRVSRGSSAVEIDWRMIFADISDLELVDRLSHGRVDLTYGR